MVQKDQQSCYCCCCLSLLFVSRLLLRSCFHFKYIKNGCAFFFLLFSCPDVYIIHRVEFSILWFAAIITNNNAIAFRSSYSGCCNCCLLAQLKRVLKERWFENIMSYMTPKLQGRVACEVLNPQKIEVKSQMLCNAMTENNFSTVLLCVCVFLAMLMSAFYVFIHSRHIAPKRTNTAITCTYCFLVHFVHFHESNQR